MTLSGALCGTFLSNGVLHRDVRASCIRSVLGCSALEYYCHCAMSVSFSRICNEIFANAVAGLRSSGNFIVLAWPYLHATLLLVIYTSGRQILVRLAFARAFACNRGSGAYELMVLPKVVVPGR